MKQTIAVVFGGRSSEHQVSIDSAAAIVSAVDSDRYEVRTIGISKSGKFVADVDPVSLSRAGLSVNEGIEQSTSWLSVLRSADVVFPVLHGPYGEDGSFQGLLEILQVPYIGSGVLGSSICMDKSITKQLLVQAGLPVVEYLSFSAYEWSQAQHSILERVEALGFPVFVKPANLGSSVGISKVAHAEGLSSAINTALEYDRKVIAERGIKGREIEISVLGNDDLEVSLPGEIIPSREFYDYAAKYVDDTSRLIIPADLPSSVVKEIQNLAARAFRVLNCRGLARIDFFLEHYTTNVYINEVNTIPGFTRISMYPKLWQHAGICLTELINRLCDLAITEFSAKSQLKV